MSFGAKKPPETVRVEEFPGQMDRIVAETFVGSVLNGTTVIIIEVQFVVLHVPSARTK